MAGANGNKRNSNARRRVRKLSPREQLELKKKLRKREKISNNKKSYYCIFNNANTCLISWGIFIFIHIIT